VVRANLLMFPKLLASTQKPRSGIEDEPSFGKIDYVSSKTTSEILHHNAENRRQRVYVQRLLVRLCVYTPDKRRGECFTVYKT
jgi:hypothetical protein